MLRRKTISKKDLERLVESGRIQYDLSQKGYRVKPSLGLLLKGNMFDTVIKDKRRYITVDNDEFPYCLKLGYCIPDFCFVDWWNCKGVEL